MRLELLRQPLAVGGIALLLGCFLSVVAGLPLLPGYLFAWLFVAAFPLGALPLLMILELLGGRWAQGGGEPLRAALRTLPVVALLFLPVLLLQDRIYPWAGSGFEPGHAAEIGYLTPWFFALRSAVYLAAWLALARVFAHQAEGPARVGLAAGGLLLHGLLGTFAGIDWAMSLEPDWRSSSYGMTLIQMQVTAALGLACALGATERVGPGVRYDLGTMLLAAVIIWAYLVFMQYLVIWSANLPEEIIWYIRRTDAGWLTVAWMIVIGLFFVPFFILISARLKQRVGVVPFAGRLVLAASLLSFAWLILPAFRRDGFSVSIQDALALVGVGGIWLWSFRVAYGRITVTAPELRHA